MERDGQPSHGSSQLVSVPKSVIIPSLSSISCVGFIIVYVCCSSILGGDALLSGRIVFGPVPSRRLGLSLGVNNVFDKYCSYSCVYCSVGHTTHMIIERRVFYEPEKILDDVLWALRDRLVDVVSFVPNGEPTLDINLGREVELLREDIDIPLAIITNSSLLYREDVQSDVGLFDIVSVKVDAVSVDVWRRINRPHPRLVLDEILDGIRRFSRDYGGRLITETMLVDGVNDDADELRGIAEFIGSLRFDKAYITTPIRPPADEWVRPPSEEKLLLAYRVFSEVLGEDRVELLARPEKPFFGFTNDLVDEIARTIYVHPIRLDYVYKLAEERGLDGGKVVEELVSKGYARIVEYMGVEFLVPRTRR